MANYQGSIVHVTTILRGEYTNMYPSNQNVFPFHFMRFCVSWVIFVTKYHNYQFKSSPFECHHWQGFHNQIQLFFFSFFRPKTKTKLQSTKDYMLIAHNKERDREKGRMLPHMLNGSNSTSPSFVCHHAKTKGNYI